MTLMNTKHLFKSSTHTLLHNSKVKPCNTLQVFIRNFIPLKHINEKCYLHGDCLNKLKKISRPVDFSKPYLLCKQKLFRECYEDWIKTLQFKNALLLFCSSFAVSLIHTAFKHATLSLQFFTVYLRSDSNMHLSMSLSGNRDLKKGSEDAQ